MKSAVVLISGRGSNLGAIVKAQLPIKLSAVLSNNPSAAGLRFAAEHGIENLAINHRDFPDRESFDNALAGAIDSFAPDLIILAGFMRILSNEFVQRYRSRIINIHPSLLPAYPGVHTHRRALEDGIKIHGCTVHFVTEQLDCGPVIIQAAVPILDSDTEETLAARVLAQEHKVYPIAIRWLAEDKVSLVGNTVRFVEEIHTGATAYLISPEIA